MEYVYILIRACKTLQLRQDKIVRITNEQQIKYAHYVYIEVYTCSCEIENHQMNESVFNQEHDIFEFILIRSHQPPNT